MNRETRIIIYIIGTYKIYLAKKKNNRSNSSQTQRQRLKRKLLKSDLNILFNREKFERLRSSIPIFSSNGDTPNGDTPNRDSKPRKSTDRKPTKLLKDPVVQKELKPGHSKWYPGDTRSAWTRPCFKDYEHVIIGDSQLKIYGQQKKEKKGFSITSFSGCDVSLPTVT